MEVPERTEMEVVRPTSNIEATRDQQATQEPPRRTRGRQNGRPNQTSIIDKTPNTLSRFNIQAHKERHLGD